MDREIHIDGQNKEINEKLDKSINKVKKREE